MYRAIDKANLSTVKLRRVQVVDTTSPTFTVPPPPALTVERFLPTTWPDLLPRVEVYDGHDGNLSRNVTFSYINTIDPVPLQSSNIVPDRQ